MIATRSSLCFVLLGVLSMISAISADWFQRDEDTGYWFDTVLQDYDPSKGTARFNCKLRIFRRNLRPAEIYHQMGLVSSNDTMHAQEGDSESSDIIKSGVTAGGGTMKSEAGKKHLCQIELGDGTKDKREIEVKSLDGAPIVYVESSKYPEMSEVPYGASFYIIYTCLGEDVQRLVWFSSCDPREQGCTEKISGQNYEENPFRFIGGNNVRKVFQTGKAVTPGFYTFQGSSDKGTATAYFQLKVADPVPATWSEESASFTEDEKNSFSEGDTITVPCIYSSPVPYKATFHWFKDGEPLRDVSKYAKTTKDRDGSVLVIKDSTTSDSGEYTCKVEFSDWSDKIKPISMTAKVKVTDDTSGNEALVQSCTLTAISTLLAVFVAKML